MMKHKKLLCGILMTLVVNSVFGINWPQKARNFISGLKRSYTTHKPQHIAFCINTAKIGDDTIIDEETWNNKAIKKSTIQDLILAKIYKNNSHLFIPYSLYNKLVENKIKIDALFKKSGIHQDIIIKGTQCVEDACTSYMTDATSITNRLTKAKIINMESNEILTQCFTNKTAEEIKNDISFNDYCYREHGQLYILPKYLRNKATLDLFIALNNDYTYKVYDTDAGLCYFRFGDSEKIFDTKYYTPISINEPIHKTDSYAWAHNPNVLGYKKYNSDALYLTGHGWENSEHFDPHISGLPDSMILSFVQYFHPKILAIDSCFADYSRIASLMPDIVTNTKIITKAQRREPVFENTTTHYTYSQEYGAKIFSHMSNIKPFALQVREEIERHQFL